MPRAASRLYMKNLCYTCHGTAGKGRQGLGPAHRAQRVPWDGFVAAGARPREAMPRYATEFVSDQELADIHAYRHVDQGGPEGERDPAAEGLLSPPPDTQPLADDVHERGLAALHDVHRALERRAQLRRIGDRPSAHTPIDCASFAKSIAGLSMMSRPRACPAAGCAARTSAARASSPGGRRGCCA
jgi:hypothetical protein